MGEGREGGSYLNKKDPDNSKQITVTDIYLLKKITNEKKRFFDSVIIFGYPAGVSPAGCKQAAIRHSKRKGALYDRIRTP
jgi:hypothetical protein